MSVDTSSIIFSPIYMIGHWIGSIIAWVVKGTYGVVLPNIIIDTVGLLAMITVLLILAGRSSKLAWGILTIGWALIIMRIGMLTMGN